MPDGIHYASDDDMSRGGDEGEKEAPIPPQVPPLPPPPPPPPWGQPTTTPQNERASEADPAAAHRLHLEDQRQRSELIQRAQAADKRTREVQEKLSMAEARVRGLEAHIKKEDEKRSAEEEKKATSKSKKAQHYNRVKFSVTANLTGPAQPVLDLLWNERPKLNDEPEFGQKVAAGMADGTVLRLHVDYTVHGGWQADVDRTLRAAARKVGLELLDIECMEKSRAQLTCPDGCCVVPEPEPGDDDVDEPEPERLEDP